MTLIRNIPDHDKPLCPRSWGPQTDPAHRTHNLIFDVVYESAPKDENDEVPPEVDRALQAVGRRFTGRMELHHEIISTHFGERAVVESWYFCCHTCGFVLPATRKDHRHEAP